MSLMLFNEPAAVFARVRKTGSTSIVEGLFGGKRKAAAIVYGDFPDEWRQHFMFGFVRNPFDRLVSCLVMFRNYPVRNAKEARQRERLTLDRLMNWAEDDMIDHTGKSFKSKARLHALPMTSPLYHLDRAQFIGRFETFEADYRRLALQLGRDVDMVPILRATPKRDYRQFFTHAQRSRAEAIYKCDLDEFGYGY